jgi:hypothetical protein
MKPVMLGLKNDRPSASSSTTAITASTFFHDINKTSGFAMQQKLSLLLASNHLMFGL